MNRDSGRRKHGFENADRAHDFAIKRTRMESKPAEPVNQGLVNVVILNSFQIGIRYDSRNEIH